MASARATSISIRRSPGSMCRWSGRTGSMCSTSTTTTLLAAPVYQKRHAGRARTRSAAGRPSAPSRPSRTAASSMSRTAPRRRPRTNGEQVFVGGENNARGVRDRPETRRADADPARRYARHPLPQPSTSTRAAGLLVAAHITGLAGARRRHRSCRPACRCSASATTAGSTSSANTMSRPATGNVRWAWSRYRRIGPPAQLGSD